MADNNMSWLTRIKFWLLAAPYIPSIICSVFILVYFYKQRHRLSAHQHFTLLLTIFGTLQLATDIPFAIIYYHYGEVLAASNSFCLWWNWWDYSLCSLLVFLMAWGSLDRHLLIFHNSIIATKRTRILFHLVPMFICTMYPMIFYLSAIILNSCENQWIYTEVSVIGSL